PTTKLQFQIGPLKNGLSKCCLLFLAGYEPKDIYNCDETAVFFKVLPNRT
ncbi:hypothetical protein HPB47_022579, partial [Ixodes persulcatus]